MPNEELSPQEASALWEKMDNQGYAGELGSNKPEATRLVQKAYEVKDEKQVFPTTPSEDVQQSFMPMSDLEKREADRLATANRLQPDGHYTKSSRFARKPQGSPKVPNFVDQLMEARQVPGWDKKR